MVQFEASLVHNLKKSVILNKVDANTRVTIDLIRAKINEVTGH